MIKKYKYLFGPVPSRRFGLSLGVDLTPHKTCTLDCVFCQLGPTTNKTIKREAYVPVDDVIHELKLWLQSGEYADYITLAGSGEPTLHSEFGKVLEYIKASTDIPCVLLTNSTLLGVPEVQNAAMLADVVKVSMSVWDDNSYSWINRPHKELNFKSLIMGLQSFRSMYHQEMRMEVFVMGGLNANMTDMKHIAKYVNQINPDRIELNTVTRPVHNDFVRPVSQKVLVLFQELFNPHAEVISDFQDRGTQKICYNEKNLLEMLKRRPCSLKQLQEFSQMHPNELSKYLGKLIKANQIETVLSNHVSYYRICNE